MSALLVVDGVCYSYDGRKAVEEVSFELDRGGVLFVLGENGSGKSTLLKLTAGILKPDRGRVFIDGKECSEYSRRELSRVVVFGGTGLNADFPLTVFEYASLGRFPHAGFFGSYTERDAGLVRESLEILGISHLADRSVHELSDGERQKAILAKMLAQDGEVYLFDEPAAHLDFKSKMEVFELARKLADRGKAVVVTSHDITLVGRYASEVMVLKEGRLFAAGDVKDVLKPDILREAFGIDVKVSEDETGRPILSF